jgi:hypothetical protein
MADWADEDRGRPDTRACTSFTPAKVPNAARTGALAYRKVCRSSWAVARSIAGVGRQADAFETRTASGYCNFQNARQAPLAVGRREEVLQAQQADEAGVQDNEPRQEEHGSARSSIDKFIVLCTISC